MKEGYVYRLYIGIRYLQMTDAVRTAIFTILRISLDIPRYKDE